MIVLTREQAYALVWSAPMRTLASEISISDVALAKTVRRAGIPMPGLGYWAKVVAGKPVSQTALPPAELTDQKYLRFNATTSKVFRDRIPGEPGERVGAAEDIQVLSDRFRKRVGRLGARRDLKVVHHEVKRLLEKDDRIRAKRDAAGEGFLANYYRPKFASAPELRRLRFINSLFLALAKFGGGGSVRGEEAEKISVYLGEKNIGIKVEYEERSKGSTYLKLRSDQPKQAAKLVSYWEDDDQGRIETKLSDIVVGLACLMELREREWEDERRKLHLRLEAEKRALSQEAERARADAEARDLKKRRKAAVKTLVQSARGAHKSELIRQYVEDANRRLAGSTDSTKLQAWSNWALALADSIDPFKNAMACELIERFDESFGSDRQRPSEKSSEPKV